MPFTTFVAGTESQTFGATGTGTVLLNLLPHDLLIVTIAHIGNGVSTLSITNSTGSLTHLTNGATGGAFTDHDVYIETWYLDNAFGFLGANDVLDFTFSGAPGLTQIIYRVVRANDGDVSWHQDISVGNSGSASPADTNNSDPSVESNEFFYAALQVFHQDDLSGAWGGSFTNGTEQSDPTFDENVVLNDGYRIVSSTGTYNATKVIDDNAFGPEWGTTLCSFYYKPRPVCAFPYRTITVQDSLFPSSLNATVNVPRGIVKAVVTAYGRGGNGAIGEGGGCGGLGIAEMTLNSVFPDTIPVNISDTGTSAGDASGEAGSSPQGGTGTGDYTINGGDGSPADFVDFTNFNGGAGCGGAAGGVWNGDTNGENGQGIGAGGGGAGGNIEVAGDPGIGGPGLGIVTLCAGLGWRQKIHRRHNTGQTNGSISHNTPLNQYTTTTGIGLRRKPIIAAGLAGPFPPTLIPSPSPQPCSDPENFDVVYNFNQPFKQQTFVNGNNFTWVAPYGVYEIILQIQENGEGGAQGGDDFGGCGGAGGECAYYVVSVIPGQSYPIVIDGTGIDWNSGEIFLDGDTSPRPGPTCDLSPEGTPGGEPECPGAGGYGGQGGQDYGLTGEDGALGGGGGGGGAGGVGGYGGEGWVRVFYVNQFGRKGGYSTQRYPTANHQTHQTGQTNFSISHCVPLNRQTTTKGISMRSKHVFGETPVPPVVCERTFGERGNFHQTHTTGQTNTSISHACGINEYTTTKGIGMRRRWIVGSVALTIPPVPPVVCDRDSNETYIASEDTIITTWTAPLGVYSVKVQCQGPGENGDGGANGFVEGWPGGSGGGAGGYAESVVAVIPGNVYSITIGAGGSGTDTNFDSIVVGGTGGPGSTGGTGNVGTITINGSDGSPGNGWVPPLTFSTGGNGGDSPTGGFGGNGGQGDNSVGAGGGIGGLGAGGGGGGGGADVGGPGGLGGAGWMVISWPSGFGNRHTFHQTHVTGQTNTSISHGCGINDWTTTKGIGMRRKWIIGAIPPPPPPPVPFTAPLYSKYVLYAAGLAAAETDPSNLRVTQSYLEVFNVDPPTPNIRTTQFYLEVMDQPPQPAGFTAPKYRRMVLRAAGLDEPAPPPACDRTFGERGNFHQTHTTGQTNTSISHDCGLNDYTTTKGIGMRRKWIAAALQPIPVPPPAICDSEITNTFIATEEISTDWTAPPGVYVITVECQGPGGTGDNGATSIVEGWPGGTGGGAGGYAKSTIAVTPGVTYTILVGAGGSTNNTDFGSGLVVGGGANGPLGGTGNTGQFTINGADGFPGVGWVPPLTFSTGGNGADGPTGGFGGNGGQGDNSVGAGGAAGGLGAGGGGGGGGADVGGPGGLGGGGWMVLSLPSGFGSRHTFHQSHSTGQTNTSISHNCALNEWTTTKGIGMRRKWIAAAALAPEPTPAPLTLCGRSIAATYTQVGTTFFTVPAGVYEILVECLGGGGGGGNGNSAEDEDGGGGGGSGAYAASILSVNPGDVFQVEVGDGGSGEGFDGFVSTFDNPPTVIADYGRYGNGQVGGLGGLVANSLGDVIIPGVDGNNGLTGALPQDGADGGSAPGPFGGAGGLGGVVPNAGSPGLPFGSGGGGGSSTFGPTGGSAGYKGAVRISWASDYGYLGDIHQYHNTGQTNYSIMHCTPLNQYTTTKGISMRRKWFFVEEAPPPVPFTAPLYSKYVLYAAALAATPIVECDRNFGERGDIHQTHTTGQTNTSISHACPLNKWTTTKGIGMRRKYFLPAEVDSSNLRVTQAYLEVFNVDPPTPNIRITQFYIETMNQPPQPGAFAAPRYRRTTLRAAGLAEPTPPPNPFNPQQYMRWVMRAAALAAALPPAPPPIVGCQACIGRYKYRVQATCTPNGTCNTTVTLISRGLQYCNCNNQPRSNKIPAEPFNIELIYQQFEPVIPIPPPLPVMEPMVPPPFPITPPIPPQVPPLPPPCPNNPPMVPVTNIGTVHVINQSNISNAELDAAIQLQQLQIDHDFAPYWGVGCNLQRSATPTDNGYNVFIRSGVSDVDGACGYHIETTRSFLGFFRRTEIIGRVFVDTAGCNPWQVVFNHEVLEMLINPRTSTAPQLGPVVTFLGRTGQFIKEVCDPVNEISYNNGKLADFIYPSWFIVGSPCPWDRLGVLPGPLTFTDGGYMPFFDQTVGWGNFQGNPPEFKQ
ncbi:hypothetical protein [Nitrospira sp. BLG_2]|uniref:glycine-rich domain-containing protein n=1 Tax=Nitrospira sp. BLG_2 TaxID=3397507 RepID=UPI003B9B48AD